MIVDHGIPVEVGAHMKFALRQLMLLRSILVTATD
jgi:hypothetical protein